MAVDVREFNARPLNFFKLRRKFRTHLRQRNSPAQIQLEERDVIGMKNSLRRDQRGNFFRRQDGVAASKREVYSDAQARNFFRDFDGGDFLFVEFLRGGEEFFRAEQSGCQSKRRDEICCAGRR